MRIPLMHCFRAVLISAAVAVAQGAIIYDNFGPGDTFGGGRIIQGPDVNTIGDVDQATTFVTGGATYVLTDATLAINATDPPNSGAGNLLIQIAEDSAGSPGAVIGSASTFVNAGQDIVMLAFGGIPLNANTLYWVIADGQDTFDGGWGQNNIGDIGLTAGRTNGLAWNIRIDDERYALRLEGRETSVIPEPSTVLMLAGGLAVLCGIRVRGRAAR
jgi:hypothetical protein